MPYYTLVSKKIHCPFWNIDLSVSGKYKLIGDTSKAQFQYGICPIIENNNLPEYKRNRKLVLYAFCKKHPCNELNSFESTIDLNK
ncbi:hypothetical protein AL713_17545 [Clostridium botulinum]|uniref:hypothetical protein n=1 Tax=Clostridium botulinum TaxID=1491 RepID=UPI00099D177B|nr:hypothetical protein [Clostridium botulinum]OPD28822.1 hypothetical protein AL713_17545 [Clostridium botulinum]